MPQHRDTEVQTLTRPLDNLELIDRYSPSECSCTKQNLWFCNYSKLSKKKDKKTEDEEERRQILFTALSLVFTIYIDVRKVSSKLVLPVKRSLRLWWELVWVPGMFYLICPQTVRLLHIVWEQVWVQVCVHRETKKNTDYCISERYRLPACWQQQQLCGRRALCKLSVTDSVENWPWDPHLNSQERFPHT